MELLIPITLLLAFFYAVYLGVRLVARRLSESNAFRSVLDVEIKESSQKFKLNIKDWFVWNATINEEKGTAAGSIKINFPIKSSLVMGIICLVIAWFTKQAVVIPAIFLCFSIYHFLQWYRSLGILRYLGVSSNLSPGEDEVGVVVRFEDCLRLFTAIYGRNLFQLLSVVIVALLFTTYSIGLFGGVLFGGIYLALGKALDREDVVVNLRDFLVPGRFIVRTTVVFVISVLCVTVGLILFVIPGIFIGTVVQYALPFAILRGTTISESFSASYHLAKTNWKLNMLIFLSFCFTMPFGIAFVSAGFHAQTSTTCGGLVGDVSTTEPLMDGNMAKSEQDIISPEG